MNALMAYLTARGERLSAFASRIGRSPSTLTRALSGARNPSVDLARDVERGTDGEVTASEFIAICLRQPAPPGRDPANFAGAERVSAPALSGEGA